MPSGDSTTTITPASDTLQPAPRIWFGGLMQRRVCTLPTWRGWMVFLLLLVASAALLGRNLCHLLTVHDPIPGGVLVVEGWVPPYAAQEALEEFQKHHYLGIYVTGLPLEAGNPYIGFHSMAEFTAKRIEEMGAPAGSVHAVPSPLVDKDRTYNMAHILKKWLETEGISTATISLVSVGPHSRRSRLLYERTFGPNTRVGVLGVTDRGFDPDHWWTNSIGFRAVIGEAIAYGYARFVFRPSFD